MVTITKFITGNSFVLKPCVPKVKNCFEIILKSETVLLLLWEKVRKVDEKKPKI